MVNGHNCRGFIKLRPTSWCWTAHVPGPRLCDRIISHRPMFSWAAQKLRSALGPVLFMATPLRSLGLTSKIRLLIHFIGRNWVSVSWAGPKNRGMPQNGKFYEEQHDPPWDSGIIFVQSNPCLFAGSFCEKNVYTASTSNILYWLYLHAWLKITLVAKFPTQQAHTHCSDMIDILCHIMSIQPPSLK